MTIHYNMFIFTLKKVEVCDCSVGRPPRTARPRSTIRATPLPRCCAKTQGSDNWQLGKPCETVKIRHEPIE